jgi:membrane-associated phospholipid phosphatase
VKINRRVFLAGLSSIGMVSANAEANALSAVPVLQDWYELILNLVRHTATYSPPVASRAFAYLGVTVYEAVASGSPKLLSLAGQLRGLKELSRRKAGVAYDDAAVLNGALAFAAQNFFSNTGPTGQRALAAMAEKMQTRVAVGVSRKTLLRSVAFGEAIAKHILDWSQSDGGADVQNLGFPDKYDLTKGPGHWVPTNTQGLQQHPLLPSWGKNRTFAMPASATCTLPPPPAYSEDKASAFYAEAKEVFDIKNNLTPEQKKIARFWSDDPMLSPTPPGHWAAVALSIFERQQLPIENRVDVLARLGVAVADAFIGCWQVKYEVDLLRPLTYIRKMFDPKWEALLITPPFPEYPSGHSVQSGAAAVVLTSAFGEQFAFEDRSHEKDGLGTRSYPDFWTAAQEAAMSRLYGGIHFRAAVERGLDQGRCIGAYAAALKTVKS